MKSSRLSGITIYLQPNTYACMTRKIIFLLLATVFIMACRKDNIDTSSGINLRFSVDTVTFDTVFTDVGSITKRLKVFNPSQDRIRISDIQLAGGDNSNFRINVDGVNQTQVSDVEILGKDSIYIFVEATIDPNDLNNPLIVKDVNDITAVVHDIIQSAFVTTGQRCTCARRLFIEKGEQGDAILSKLIEATKALTIGYYDDEEQPFIGSMISEKAALGLVDAQQKLLYLGATSLLELKHLEDDTGFISPGIVDVTSIVDKVPDEEYFGPLLKVYRYTNFDEAINEANNTSFGLSAGLLSDSEALYNHFFTRIRAGIVNWNKPITGASSAAPFGGIGASGNHRASAFYAADYCAYPLASVEAEKVSLPATLSPGIKL